LNEHSFIFEMTDSQTLSIISTALFTLLFLVKVEGKIHILRGAQTLYKCFVSSY